MPEESGGTAGSAAAAFTPDPAVMTGLLDMGLTENACKRACKGVQNAGLEAAAGWFFEHAEDPDLNDPLPEGGDGGGASAGADPEQVMMICSMGFSDKQAAAALKHCSNNVER